MTSEPMESEATNRAVAFKAAQEARIAEHQRAQLAFERENLEFLRVQEQRIGELQRGELDYKRAQLAYLRDELTVRAREITVREREVTLSERAAPKPTAKPARRRCKPTPKERPN